MKRTTGFSLIELLVVMSVIAVLAALLLPSVALVRQAAQTAGCASNQRQVVMAVTAYANEHRGVLPYSFGPTPTSPGGTYWYTHQDAVGQYLGFDKSAGSGAISQIQGPWRILKCPSNTQSPQGVSYGLNHRFCCDNTYKYSSGVVVFPPGRVGQISNTSMTVLCTDVAGDGRIFVYNPLRLFGNGNIAQTADWALDYPWRQPFLPVMRHRKGCVVGFVDGHVRTSPNLAVEDQAVTVHMR